MTSSEQEQASPQEIGGSAQSPPTIITYEDQNHELHQSRNHNWDPNGWRILVHNDLVVVNQHAANDLNCEKNRRQRACPATPPSVNELRNVRDDGTDGGNDRDGSRVAQCGRAANVGYREKARAQGEHQIQEQSQCCCAALHPSGVRRQVDNNQQQRAED